MRLISIAAATLFVIQAQAEAADVKPALYILVETLPADAGKCGITEEVLRAPAINTLRRNGIESGTESGTFPNPYLYLNLNILNFGSSLCVYNLNASIQTSQQSIARGQFSAREREGVELCSQSIIVSRVPLNAARSVSESVEQLVGLCIAKLKY